MDENKMWGESYGSCGLWMMMLRLQMMLRMMMGDAPDDDQEI